MRTPESEYQRGLQSSLRCHAKDSPDSIRDSINTALSDLDEDAFTRGWVVGCRQLLDSQTDGDIQDLWEKANERYGEKL